MKKIVKVVVLILTLSIVMLFMTAKDKFTAQSLAIFGRKVSNLELKYVIVSQRERPFSVNHLHSDVATNSLIMDALVGTLVKEDAAGELRPYLAEKWTTSGDGKLWTFYVREGLKAEDGTIIDAPSFVENLNLLLRVYSKDGSAMQFDHMTGWQDFISGKSKHLKGLRAVDAKKIELAFTTAPTDLLNLLKTPYFGFYSKSNFAGDEWLDDKKIVSSGAYRLQEITAANHPILIKRTDWPLNKNGSPTRVEVEFVKEYVPKESSESIIVQSVPDAKMTDFNLVKGIPSFISVMVLSPIKDGPFKSEAHRRAFASKVASLRDSLTLKSSRSKVTPWFNFLHQPKDQTKMNYDGGEWSANGVHLTATNIGSFLSADEKSWIEGIIQKVSTDLGAVVKYEEPKLSDPEWVDKALSNKAYDIRIVNVHVGGFVSNMNNKIMFCSNLGVRFPDHTGKICDLVKEYEKKGLEFDYEYIQRFYEVLFEDAVVVPFFNFGLTWYYSKDISLEDVSPISDFPRFELLKIVR